MKLPKNRTLKLSKNVKRVSNIVLFYIVKKTVFLLFIQRVFAD